MASKIYLYGLFGLQRKATPFSFGCYVVFDRVIKAIIAKGNKIEGIEAME